MRQGVRRRSSERRQADFIVDGRGRTRAAASKRSPLWTFALAGMAGVALTSPELAVGEAVLASGRAAAHGSEILIASARAAVRSAADLIRSRSPGTRTAAHLIKIKHPPVVAARPVARAKPRLRPPPAGLPAFLAPPPAATPLAFADQPFAPGWQPIGAFPAGPIEEAIPCGCGFVYIPPLLGGGGVVFGPGGGGTGPGGPGGPNPPPPPPGVPEPESWAMMILGFTVIGSLWRRRRVILAAIPKLPLLPAYKSSRRLSYAPIR